MLATVCCRWSKVHIPAWTHTTSATTATTERIEEPTTRQKIRDPNPSPRFN